ncbi:MAG: phosphotransferase [Alicyclobacillus sp.]|nr:phosphotransferase [Alicyclobacillus sp.]
MFRRFRQPSPPWMADLLKELLRPPYFLEHLQRQTHTTPTAQTPEQAAQADRVHPSVPRSVSSHRSRAQVGMPPLQTAQPNRTAWSSVASAHSAPAAAAQLAAAPAPGLAAPSATGQTNMKEHKSWQTVFRAAHLPPALAKAYGWQVTAAERAGSAVKVTTPRGVYACKRADVPVERVRFIRDILTFARQAGFQHCCEWVPARRGQACVVRGTAVYYATRWVPGQSLSLTQPTQLAAAARSLAGWHEATRGFEAARYNPPDEFDLPGLLRQRTDDLRVLLLRAEAARQPDAFDELLRRLAPSLRRDAEHSLRIVSHPSCQEFLQRDAELPGVCHLDVTPSNLVYTPQQQAVLIDFDLATFAPRALDLAHLLRRSLQLQHWRGTVAYTCFREYQAVRPLESAEYLLVQALLTFPYRAWRIAHTRYRLYQDNEQVQELRGVSEQEEERQAFLREFADQLQVRVH